MRGILGIPNDIPNQNFVKALFNKDCDKERDHCIILDTKKVVKELATIGTQTKEYKIKTKSVKVGTDVKLSNKHVQTSPIKNKAVEVKNVELLQSKSTPKDIFLPCIVIKPSPN